MQDLTVAVGPQDHAQGSEDAPCSLLEYGDYQCPSCREAYGVVHRVQKHFGERLRFVFRNFPLEQHPLAEPAAETAEFAAAHGKFWEMHDGLYKNQSRLSKDLFVKLAGELGFEEAALTKALDRGEFAQRVKTDLESGEASGVGGTPTFYINGQQYEGDADAASLIEAIENAIRT